MTTPQSPSLSDLWNGILPSVDEVHEYAVQAASEIIRDTRYHWDGRSDPTDRDIAESISADQVEAASFVSFSSAPDFDLDPSLVHLLIETAISIKLGVLPSVISSQY